MRIKKWKYAKSTGKVSKWILILGGFFVLVLIMAIGGGGERKETLLEEKTAEKKVYQIGETIPCKNWNWKVVEAKDVTANVKNTEGKWVEIVLEGENTGKKGELRGANLSIIDDQERKYGGYKDDTCWLRIEPGFPPRQCSKSILVAKSSEKLTLHLSDLAHCEVDINLGSF